MLRWLDTGSGHFTMDTYMFRILSTMTSLLLDTNHGYKAVDHDPVCMY